MYLPAHFEDTDSDAIAGLIAAFPLATLVCLHGGEMIANHIPLMMNGREALVGPIARANTLHELIGDGARVLAIFGGDDSYISPNWYPTKPVTRRHVPTWNYQVVHIRGRITFSHARKDKLAVVGRLTKTHEQAVFGDRAWKMSDAPRDYMDQMLDNIVAFSIDIDSISAKSKLSQNRDLVDFDGVVREMEMTGRKTLSASMKRLRGDAD